MLHIIHTQPIVAYDRTPIDLCRNEISSAIFCGCIHLPDLSALGRSITNGHRVSVLVPVNRLDVSDTCSPFFAGDDDLIAVTRWIAMRSIDRSADNETASVLGFVRARASSRGFSRPTRWGTLRWFRWRSIAISSAIDAALFLSCRAPDLTVGTERLRLRLKSRIHSRRASERASERASRRTSYRERAHSVCGAYCTM